MRRTSNRGRTISVLLFVALIIPLAGCGSGNAAKTGAAVSQTVEKVKGAAARQVVLRPKDVPNNALVRAQTHAMSGYGACSTGFNASLAGTVDIYGKAVKANTITVVFQRDNVLTLLQVTYLGETRRTAEGNARRLGHIMNRHIVSGR